MKKIFVCLFIYLCISSTYAKTLSCPFTDSFYLQAEANNKILTLTTKDNVHAVQVSAAQFNVSCASNQNGGSGDIFVTIGSDNNNQCALTIHDGPFEQNPLVNAVQCKGKLQYNGMDHNVWEYKYILKFSNN